MKILTTLIISMLLISTLGLATATDVTLTGMDADKSIGNQGVMKFNDTSKGLCTDKDTYINFGDSVPVTPGTTGITNASKVKSLIVNFYRNDMTQQQGYDLQGASWYFTNGITPANPAQQSMINTALSDTTIYPDTYTLLLKNETKLVNNNTETITEIIGTATSTNSVITQIDQKTDINSVVTPNGQTTDSSTITNFLGSQTDITTQIVQNGNKICTITTKTITDFYDSVTTTIVTSFFKNTTTNNTTNYYMNTTTVTTNNTYKQTNTTTETWESTLSYLDFTFNSIQAKCKQEIILFNAIDRTVKESWKNTYSNSIIWNTIDIQQYQNFYNVSDIVVDVKEFNTTDTQVTHDLFNETNVTIDKKCREIPTNNTTTNETTIPMQPTGFPVIPLILGVLTIAGGLAIRNKL